VTTPAQGKWFSEIARRFAIVESLFRAGKSAWPHRISKLVIIVVARQTIVHGSESSASTVIKALTVRSSPDQPPPQSKREPGFAFRTAS
jgi:hypothetical protein